MKKIVVVDDDERALQDLAEILEKEGYTVVAFNNALSAIAALEVVQDIDLVLTDIHMPAVDGTVLMDKALKLKRPVPVIVFTGYGDIDTAVNIMKAGASDFLCKPISSSELSIRVKKVLEKQALADEVASLRRRLECEQSFHSIVGKSKKMLDVYELIGSVASTDATVLITGETGTGKELIARAIHAASERKDAPFKAISCAALQPTLLESELFGYERGAFTGAASQKTGKLEAAGKGTVLLDEIGDIPLDIQSKLLRVLQEKSFERVGGIKPVALEARVIAATNKPLELAVKNGMFREDLFYRLNVVRIDLPPLRERAGDVLMLANHFLDIYRQRYNKNIDGFAPSAITQILEHHWPGNIREMQNAIERTVLTNPRRWIDKLSRLDVASGIESAFADMPYRLPYVKAREAVWHELEKTYLVQFMKQEKGQINRVADLMGVSTRTVSRQLEKYNLDKVLFKKHEEPT